MLSYHQKLDFYWKEFQRLVKLAEEKGVSVSETLHDKAFDSYQDRNLTLLRGCCSVLKSHIQEATGGDQ